MIRNEKTSNEQGKGHIKNGLPFGGCSLIYRNNRNCHAKRMITDIYENYSPSIRVLLYGLDIEGQRVKALD